MLSNDSLRTLPKFTELALSLICADLKAAKFFGTLRNVGLDDCFYRTDFSTQVLECLGFENLQDDLFDLYFKLIEDHFEKIQPNNDLVMETAKAVYAALIVEKEKRERYQNGSDSESPMLSEPMIVIYKRYCPVIHEVSNHSVPERIVLVA